ncbi:DUF992 domain-containing protein [Methylocapsa sp. S129]|uniref:DUF992 domain-containing protein n=1 Tax=Methylocapsa sp. S129 TaxID=1641869 RepID=UPI00131E49D6|nr:DUF992 domain-containing protein [Methylocapsa sp. S129]
MSIRAALCIAALTATVAAASPASAQQQSNVKVGALRCEVAAGLGMIIASSKEMECRFTSARGYTEHYYGTIRKFGLDIGQTNRGTLAWDVFAPTMGPRRHALAGDYAGVDASATVGAGIGANALVGGLDRSFTLQPLSIQTQTGLALAAGVASLTLRPGR